jgi:hypothetical protein
MEYPFVEVRAYDVTNPEVSCTVHMAVASASLPIPDVSEQDVVDVVKGLFSQQPNIAVSAYRYEVTASPA